MYAVIETGGKQYRVSPGDEIEVELLDGVGDGGEVEFERVLLVAADGGVTVGTPEVAGAQVKGKLLGEAKGPKLRVFKMKRRKGFRRTRGHRQHLSRVRIEEIAAG